MTDSDSIQSHLKNCLSSFSSTESRGSLEFIFDKISSKLKFILKDVRFTSISGFSSFLRVSYSAEKRIFCMCQCPFGLLFISTTFQMCSGMQKVLCQCPFGLLFISTLALHNTYSDFQQICAGTGFTSVSMPFWAFLHFYRPI